MEVYNFKGKKIYISDELEEGEEEFDLLEQGVLDDTLDLTKIIEKKNSTLEDTVYDLGVINND